MPAQPTVTQIRLQNIAACFAVTVDTLDAIARSFETPFLQPITNTAKSLLSAVETVRTNKENCAHLMEQTYKLVSAIISLHLQHESGPDFSPATLNHLGRFTDTLHKIHTFVEAQQDRGKINRFFRQGEMGALLKNCNAGLREALDAFKVHDAELLKDVAEMQKYAQERHQEVLDLIEASSEAVSSDRASSVNRVYFGSYNSSNSISMLPSEPKIFHGRESQLADILEHFATAAPRIAILGAGGMGKTSLARAILHHPQVTARYDHHRYFIACDTASSKLELVALIGAHLGLKAGTDLTKPVIKYFSNSLPSLLIIDNLETLWEPLETRLDIEEFLSLLADIQDLALIITMRGAERPAKIRWTRPFLEPLDPLAQEAARQTFSDIADEGHDVQDIDRVLLLTDNMPLAIDLIAHLVDLEGFPSVLSRWVDEKTTVISEGCDKRSNLDLSISLSLTSPRIKSSPHAHNLLSLLAMLPDGLSDVELLQSNIPIVGILSCKATLLRNSLAYLDDKRRLKTLIPIREYMKKHHPTPSHFVQPLLKHFEGLLDFYNRYGGTLPSSGINARISTNFANIQNMLLNGLQTNDLGLATSIYCICYLETFSVNAGRGHLPLLDRIPQHLPRPTDHRLEVYFITELMSSWRSTPLSGAEALVEQARGHLPHFDDPDIKCKFYNILGDYYQGHDNDVPAAMASFQTALDLACSTGNSHIQSKILTNMAWMKRRCGDSAGGQISAYEAQRVARISADLWREASAISVEVMCWYTLGNYKHALSLCHKARNLLVLCGMSGGEVDHHIMSSMGEIHMLKTEYMEALKIHTQMLDEMVEEDPGHHAAALINIAQVDLLMWAPKDIVQSNLDAASSKFKMMNMVMYMTWCDMFQADLNVREGNTLAAAETFQNCLDSAWGKHTQIVTYCLKRLANKGCWPPAHDSSTWATIYLVHSLRAKQKLDIYKALQFLGDVFEAENDMDTAIGMFSAALDGFTQMDVHHGRAECMLHLGDISRGRGDVETAVELWTAAKPLFARSSQIKQAELVEGRLAIAGISVHHLDPDSTVVE